MKEEKKDDVLQIRLKQYQDDYVALLNKIKEIDSQQQQLAKQRNDSVINIAKLEGKIDELNKIIKEK